MFRIPIKILIGLIAASGRSGQAEASPCDLTQVPFCTWIGNYNRFIAAGDTVSTIDFESLPNGAPSFGGAAITPAFNYALQGALFTPAFPNQFLTGNSQVGYALMAYTFSPIAHNSITAQLTNAERGVGVWVIGHTTLFAYDAQGSLITSVGYDDPNGIEYFLGIKSSVPIARAVIDNGQNIVALDDFTMIHVPVPEPATAALLLLAAPILFRRAHRRWR